MTASAARPNKLPKIPSGQVALIFDNKDEMVRCLDIVSEYKGIVCRVSPWDVVSMPMTSLATANGCS